MNKKSDLSLSLAIHGKNGNYANYEQTLIEASSLGISKVSYVLIGKKTKRSKSRSSVNSKTK